MTEALSGADLRAVCRAAAVAALRRSAEAVVRDVRGREMEVADDRVRVSMRATGRRPWLRSKTILACWRPHDHKYTHQQLPLHLSLTSILRSARAYGWPAPVTRSGTAHDNPSGSGSAARAVKSCHTVRSKRYRPTHGRRRGDRKLGEAERTRRGVPGSPPRTGRRHTAACRLAPRAPWHALRCRQHNNNNKIFISPLVQRCM
jgi:SpoVK/Ycf46/Vps4 family AAA+-type ATPase